MGSSAVNGTMVAGRSSQPAPTRPTSVASTVISFDSIDTVSTSFSYVELEDTVTEQPSDPAPQDKPVVRSQFTRPEFIQHSRFFFDDGNITFLVEGILYRVHRYFFCRDSNEFAAKLLQLSSREQPEGDSLAPIVSLQDVKAEELDVFLSVLYPQSFNVSEKHSFEEWTSILRLSTRWGFSSVRELAIRCIEFPTPYDKLLIARRYSVDQWLIPALVEMCERDTSLTLDEARLMELEDVVLIGSVRESIRSRELAAAPEEVSDCIIAWRRGEPWTLPNPPFVTCGDCARLESPPVKPRILSPCPSPLPPVPEPVHWGFSPSQEAQKKRCRHCKR